MTDIMRKVKRAVSAVLAVIMTVTVMSVAVTPVFAAEVYDPAAALAYAKAHWDDGKGECAEFVRDCLKAGGLTSLTRINCNGLKNQIVDGGFGELKKLTSTNGRFLMSSNRDSLSAGDPMIWYCGTCGSWPHMVLCGGQNSSGYATNYAHNSAHNNTVTYLSLGSSSSHYGHNLTVYSIHMYSAGYYPLDEYDYATYTVINEDGTKQRSAPYAELDGEDTGIIDAAVGTVLTVLGFYTNDNGVKYAKIESGYWVLAADLERTADLDSLSISGETKPSSIEKGSSFSLKGTITSKSSPISSLTAGIYYTDGSAATEKTVNPDSTTASLSLIDSYIAFGKLFTGNYIYRVTAKNAIAEKTLIEHEFSVYSDDYVTVTFDAGEGECDTSSLKAIKGEYLTEVPTATREGYVFDGWYTDDGEKVTLSTEFAASCTVTAYWTAEGDAIPDESLKTAVDEYVYAAVTVNTDTLIRTVPYAVYFGEDTSVRMAQSGEELTVIGYCENSYGQKWYQLDDYTWVCGDDVTFAGELASIVVTDAVYPEQTVKGKGFSISGTVTSLLSDITSLTVGVYTEDGTAATSKTVTPNSLTYSIKNVDSYIKFGALSLGRHFYRITAENDFGKQTVLEQEFLVVSALTTIYTVTFDAGEGECDTASLKVATGTAISPLPTATREGYVFGGWFDESGNEVTASTAVTADMTLTAKWVADEPDSPTADDLVWETKGYLYATYSGNGVTLRNVPYEEHPDIETEVATLNGTVTVIAYTENYYGEKWLLTDEGDWVKESDVTKVEDLVPFTLSDDTNYPEKIHLSYTSCKLNGIITSLNTPITEVNGGIFDTSGTRIYGKTVTASSDTFDIDEIDYYIAFRKLGAGEYFYRVTVTNSCGTYNVIDYAFTVVDELPTYSTVTFDAGEGECDTATRLRQAPLSPPI